MLPAFQVWCRMPLRYNSLILGPAIVRFACHTSPLAWARKRGRCCSMSKHPLTDSAWKVNDLMRLPKAREWLLGQCCRYIRQRETDADSPPPLDWKRALTLADKCAMLVALHSIVCSGEEKSDSARCLQSPLSHEDRKNAIRWAALISNVQEKLGPQHRDHVQSWLKDAEAGFQQEQNARGGRENGNDSDFARVADQRRAEAKGTEPTRPDRDIAEEQKALAAIIARDRAETAAEKEHRRQGQEQAKPIARIREALRRMKSYGGPVGHEATADADWVERLTGLYDALAQAQLLHLLDYLPDRGEARRLVLNLLRWAGLGQGQLAVETLANVAPLGKLDASLAMELTHQLHDDLAHPLPEDQSTKRN